MFGAIGIIYTVAGDSACRIIGTTAHEGTTYVMGTGDDDIFHRATARTVTTRNR